LLQFIRLDMMMALVVIVGGAAFVAANLRPTPDAGGYHFPAIRWLAEHGIMTGVAHIQPSVRLCLGPLGDAGAV
jgi:hypothetical protein